MQFLQQPTSPLNSYHTLQVKQLIIGYIIHVRKLNIRVDMISREKRGNQHGTTTYDIWY